MDISGESEFRDYSSDSEIVDENWKSNMKPNDDNTEKYIGDIHVSDISVSSADTYTPKPEQTLRYSMPIEITNWEPILVEDKLTISGLIAGSVQTDRVCKQRLSSLIFKADDGATCCILGPMKTPNDAPEIICNQFKYINKLDTSGEKLYKDGLPENWQKLCIIWKMYNDTVIKSTFDWILHFDSLSIIPLNQINGQSNNKILPKKPQSKVMRKYEKYKSMIEMEILRESLNPQTESEGEKPCINIYMNLRKKKMGKNGQSPLNKRTSCYINNLIPIGDSSTSDTIHLADLPDKPASPDLPEVPKNTVYCQTELTLNNFVAEKINDEPNTNVTVLSPTKCAIINNNYNDSNNKNKKNIHINEDEPNIKLIDPLINDIISETNDDSSSLEFFDNIVANSTQINLHPAKPQQTNETCKNINYICSKTLERFSKRRENSNIKIDDNNDSINEHSDFIDIDLFSQTIFTCNSNNNSSQDETEITPNNVDVISVVDSCSSNDTSRGIKRKSDVLDDKSPDQSIRFSLRKRKKLNYREIVFNRIKVPESSIIFRPRRNMTPRGTPASTNRKKYINDPKLYEDCFVVLVQENFEANVKTPTKKQPEEKPKEIVKEAVKETVKESPKKDIPQKENIRLQEHVFKAPVMPREIKKKKFNKTFHLPNHMPKINHKKLSLPANPIEMWQIIKCRPKPLQDCASTSSPFSILSDVSSESSDKKRRKLFSPDNWMQSDGCLKTLSQNRYESSDDTRFSIRFDNVDASIDSEFSDSSILK